MQFFQDMAINPFLQTGLLAGLLAAVSCGVMGPYVISRRIVFLSGAIAHMAVGGIGAAIFLNNVYPETWGWLHPLHGAVVSALLAAVIIGLLHEQASERVDTLIGALWAVGMAAGILLIKYTPGYQTELMSYLFGNIVYVTAGEVKMMVILNVLIIVTVIVFYKRLLAICLDRQQAELQGVNVVWVNILLLSLVALTVICLIQIVGLILVIALLTLPAATAAHHVARMAPLILVSTVLAAIVTTLPRIAVYGTRISPESAIVLSAGGVYLLSVLIRQTRRKVAVR
jgi:zinc transport system permease protein